MIGSKHHQGINRKLKIGIVLSTNEAELAWNAFRFGIRAIENNHTVRTFLLAHGVECEDVIDDKFNVKQMMQDYVSKGGVILTCGSCLKIRNKEGTQLCPISTMQDMVDLTVESDRVLTFG